MNDREACLSLILEMRQLLKLEIGAYNIKNIKHIMRRNYGAWFDKKRSDYHYKLRLTDIRSNVIENYWVHNHSDVLSLYKCICEKLYIARNITADDKMIEECLSELDKLYNADNDHNGQSSEIEVIMQTYRVQKELLLKYEV